jgi:hypothetical protein
MNPAGPRAFCRGPAVVRGADVSVGRGSNPSRTMGCWESRGHIFAVEINDTSAQMNRA